MNDIIQWAVVAVAVIASTIVMARKLRKKTTSICDGCCEGCKTHADANACDDPKRRV